MNFTTTQLERQLLETAAGQAVYDALVQANMDPRNVPLETVKQMLVMECRDRVRSLTSRAAFASC